MLNLNGFNRSSEPKPTIERCPRNMGGGPLMENRLILKMLHSEIHYCI